MALKLFSPFDLEPTARLTGSLRPRTIRGLAPGFCTLDVGWLSPPSGPTSRGEICRVPERRSATTTIATRRVRPPEEDDHLIGHDRAHALSGLGLPNVFHLLEIFSLSLASWRAKDAGIVAWAEDTSSRLARRRMNATPASSGNARSEGVYHALLRS